MQCTTSLDGARVLVVEDLHEVALEVEYMLRDLGCDVVGPAPSVKRALRLIEREKLDGAVLDIDLNGEDSVPIATELLRRSIPFMFATGFDAPEQARAFDSAPLINKPFTERELEDALRRALACDEE